MIRIGIDVGGTNTDAVLIGGPQVEDAVKTPTTPDVTTGVETALRNLLHNTSQHNKVEAVMIGTTHFVNAVVQRRNLNKAAALRICLPSGTSLRPTVDWPIDLATAVDGGAYLVAGGHEYDGRPLAPLDEPAVAKAARSMRQAGVTAVAITAVFSPLTDELETRAAEIIQQEHPEVRITLSSRLGRIGLLERENVALLNAALTDLAATTITAFEKAIADVGIKAPLYVTQNDGTVASVEMARHAPVFGFASGPTNSMRGAAFLSGIESAIVLDIGGTTSDVGCLISGFPREANNVVDVGGVRTNFRMPDVQSIALGGGTIVNRETLAIGPRSVGHLLTEEALTFGGDMLTLTDIAVAKGLAEIGDPDRVKDLPLGTVDSVMTAVADHLIETVDRMKTHAEPEPLLVVGGGAMLAPMDMPGISEVRRIPHHGVANAVGAATAQISGEVDRVFHNMQRDELLAAADAIARDKAIEAGADPATLKTIEREDLPLAYLPGNAVRARVRVVGDVRRPSPDV
ncbi:MAG: Acetophenone carboxylase gamma subunit [Alphaproteobacteria bacterium MarineAlpha4_Bin2]|nr:MAG: Acetophenone carboxylase gamma subunit [Alphaproteobacteria bacterium MarineAlpha4_Bin2]